MKPLCLTETVVQPSLSICVPTWNRCERLSELMEGLGAFLASNVLPVALIELVVVENGSTDGTVQFLEGFAARYPQLTLSLWSNEINLGADVNYLHVIEASRGRWLWLIGDDEKVCPDRLPDLLQALADTSHLAMLYGVLGRITEIEAPTDIDFTTFLRPQFDLLGSTIQQIGLFFIEREVALPHLWRGYREGVGHLHAYSFLTFGTLRDHGSLRLVEVPGLVRYGDDKPRWNQMQGHIGAWRSAVAALPAARDAISARESRLRATAIGISAAYQLAQDGRMPQGVSLWMLRSFAWQHKPWAAGVALLAFLPALVTRAVVRSVFRLGGKTPPSIAAADGY